MKLSFQCTIVPGHVKHNFTMASAFIQEELHLNISELRLNTQFIQSTWRMSSTNAICKTWYGSPPHGVYETIKSGCRY